MTTILNDIGDKRQLIISDTSNLDAIQSWLRKGENTGGREVALVTAKHVSKTVSACYASVREFGLPVVFVEPDVERQMMHS